MTTTATSSEVAISRDPFGWQLTTHLHLGCGMVHLPAPWLNVDNRDNVMADVVTDIGKLKGIRERSVKAIYACHVLDHFSRWEYMDVLRRWQSLLVDDCTLTLSVINFATVVKQYARYGDCKSLAGVLHARQDESWNIRKMSWDYKSLEDDLIDAGFRTVAELPGDKPLLCGIVDCSCAKYPDGTPISLNVMAIA